MFKTNTIVKKWFTYKAIIQQIDRKDGSKQNTENA